MSVCTMISLGIDGVPEEKLCPDGLLFEIKNPNHERCDLPFTVDCGTRTELQPAQSSVQCPRKNGYFSHEDPEVCDRFYNCVEGVYSVNFIFTQIILKQSSSLVTCYMTLHCEIWNYTGVANSVTCPSGLIYDDYQGTCTWQESAQRKGCEKENRKKGKDEKQHTRHKAFSMLYI